jgi:nucleoside recognition membrane protein YjiH
MGDQDTSDQLFHLADRVIGLIKLVVWLLALLIVGLLVFYGYLITQPQEVLGGATGHVKDLIQSLWAQMTPYVAQFVRLVAPIFVLLFALGILHRLGKEGAMPFDTSKLMSDLPSALALLIIATICLLPLAGLSVPDVLNNIALVVVGFYFGKRKTLDEGN